MPECQWDTALFFHLNPRLAPVSIRGQTFRVFLLDKKQRTGKNLLKTIYFTRSFW